METSESRRGSCMRKTMSFDNSMTDFSQQSIVFAMERFARSVANMDETVMVPCKLMDVPVGSDPDMDGRVPRRSRDLIRDCQAADLHSLYSVLNLLKNELIWGSPASTTVTEPSSPQPGRRSTTTTLQRRPSVNSMMSSVSSGIGSSDSDSESGLDHEGPDDSGAEADGEESIQRIAQRFRRHLGGLHQCLEQLSDAAHYLTHRYQLEIGNAD